MEPVFPGNGDIVKLPNGDYAIVMRSVGIREIRKLGFIGLEVKSHGKEFIVDETDVTLVDAKEIRDIFIKEHIENI